ncbi:hypothetical protein BASA83_009915 [Batrachochytrium salamandrivorans]|nr:hypothetical protein BASA83_009915 [Batrachochytrium salamandrivorans]
MLIYNTIKSSLHRKVRTDWALHPTRHIVHARHLQVAVIGAGPAGFYTASKLLKSDHVRVDMFEQLPVPFGLVRYGVAPDHPEVKNVITKFNTVAEMPGFHFFGNVSVGKDISLHTLRTAYDAVVLAYGSSAEHKLGIEDEAGSSSNVFSSREFVGWYNGHPHHVDLPVDLSSTDTAIVVGQGNVALDVARILLSPIDTLAKTDISRHALEKLSTSRIRHVHLVGRRGPFHVAFTSKELRELAALSNVFIQLDHAWLEAHLSPYSDILKSDRVRRRLMDLLLKSSMQGLALSSQSERKRCVFEFLLSPRRLMLNESGSTVAGVEFETNHLVGEGLAQRAVGSGGYQQIPAGLVVSSIGYKNEGLNGAPFDASRGIVPNSRGRVEG